MLTEWDSVKCRNASIAGRATFCVETTVNNGTDRRYATAEGPVRIERSVSARELTALDRRYGRQDDDPFDEHDYANSAVMVLTPEQWIAWSDAD